MLCVLFPVLPDMQSTGYTVFMQQLEQNDYMEPTSEREPIYLDKERNNTCQHNHFAVSIPWKTFGFYLWWQ